MKKLLVYILILGFISGIIPALAIYLMEKSVLFTIAVGTVDFICLAKMFCE